MVNLLLVVIAKSKYIYYFGTEDMTLFVSSLVFGYIGCIVMLMLNVGNRDPTTSYSPAHFSWQFFFKDNVVKLLLDVILVAIFIRFLPEFCHEPINQFYAFLIGLGSDKLASYAKIARDKLLPMNSTMQKTTLLATATTVSEDAQPTQEVNEKKEEIVKTNNA